MWIERGDFRLVSAVEIKTARSGSEFAVARGGFLPQKDAPQGTPRVWFAVTFFGDLSAVRTAQKGDKVTFKGKLESRTFTTRDGETRTEPQLVVSEVHGVEASTYAEGRPAVAAVGARHSQGLPPMPAPEPYEGGEEDLPF